MKQFKHVEIITQESQATERDALYIIPTDTTYCKIIIVSSSGAKRELGFDIPSNIALTDKYDVNNNLIEQGNTYFKTQVDAKLDTEKNLREVADANLAEVFTDVSGVVNGLVAWRNALVGADADALVNTITEIISVMQNIPEGTDIFGVLSTKLNVSDVVNTLVSNLTDVPLSAYQGKVLNDFLQVLDASVSEINAKFVNQDSTLRIDANGINSNVSITEANAFDVTTVILPFEPVQILGIYVDGLRIKDTDYALVMPQTINFIIDTTGKDINIQYRHLITI